MAHQHGHEYQPKANSHLVLPHKVGSVSLEYIKLLDDLAYAPDLAARHIHIKTDTTLELHDSLAELHGDAIFVFNALARARDERQCAAQLWNFEHGFRTHTRSRRSLSTYFSRAIEALDSWGRETSGSDLIERNMHGSGPNINYRFMPDIAIIDDRFHNRQS